MKVVLFCGGLGTRLREHSETIPKPLVNVGYRPLIWHLMRYYAHFGHTEFILALGYRGDLIRDYFLNYNEAMTNDFTLSNGGLSIDLMSRDLDDWKITFVDTGMHSNLGERLRRVQKYIGNDTEFMANYSDGLSDLPLDQVLADFRQRNVIGSFVSVRTNQSFHAVQAGSDGLVTGVGQIGESELWLNGGFFCFKREIFEYIQPGEELVETPFARLIEKRQLSTYKYEGFWKAMDTFKDKITLDRMEAKGECPWMVWQNRAK